MNLLIILCCHNRVKMTMQCIQGLIVGNKSLHLRFVVVDDGSTDGTKQELERLGKIYAIDRIGGDGNLYYSGGMRAGMDYVLSQREIQADYVVLVNDDVTFYPECLEKLVVESKEENGAIVVGTTCNQYGELSYGAIKYKKKNSVQYSISDIQKEKTECDTFNANCVVIPYEAFVRTGSMDIHYRHALGDFDYGLSLKRKGYRIIPSNEYVGVCNNNSNMNTWMDKRLGRIERLKKKENVKGAPLKTWFYYLNKNFGLGCAIRHSLTPYIRILLGI